MDWNFVGTMRTRPNKWRVEMGGTGDVWKEWSFAKDDFGQCYYMERWERRPGDGRGVGRCLALRCSADDQTLHRDKMLLVVGDHFAFLRGRTAAAAAVLRAAGAALGSSAVEAVDGAVARGDRAVAEAVLAVEGGHGRITGSAWVVDAATHPWQEGRPCEDLLGGAPPSVRLLNAPPPARGGPVFLGWTVGLGGSTWEVLECSEECPEALEAFLLQSCQATAEAPPGTSRI
jgi:hypothetical protein